MCYLQNAVLGLPDVGAVRHAYTHQALRKAKVPSSCRVKYTAKAATSKMPRSRLYIAPEVLQVQWDHMFHLQKLALQQQRNELKHQHSAWKFGGWVGFFTTN